MKHYSFSGSAIDDHNAGFHADVPRRGCSACYPPAPQQAAQVTGAHPGSTEETAPRAPGRAVRWWRSIAKWGSSQTRQSFACPQDLGATLQRS